MFEYKTRTSTIYRKVK